MHTSYKSLYKLLFFSDIPQLQVSKWIAFTEWIHILIKRFFSRDWPFLWHRCRQKSGYKNWENFSPALGWKINWFFGAQRRKNGQSLEFFSDHMICRGVINGKADKAAVLPKFSDTLTLSQSGGEGRLCLNIGFASRTIFCDYAPDLITFPFEQIFAQDRIRFWLQNFLSESSSAVQ